MNACFHNLPAKVETCDGRNLVFIGHLLFDWNGKTYRVPIGAKTDGASTPRVIWREIPPFGVYAPAAWAHDAGYQDTLEVMQPDASWIKASLTKDQCDQMLNDLMACLGTPEYERITIYEGVHLGGGFAFQADRDEAAKAAMVDSAAKA